MDLFQAGIPRALCFRIALHVRLSWKKVSGNARHTQRKNKRRLLQWRVTARATRPVRVPGVALGREAMRQGEKSSSIRLFRVCGVPSRQLGSGGLDDLACLGHAVLDTSTAEELAAAPSKNPRILLSPQPRAALASGDHLPLEPESQRARELRL